MKHSYLILFLILIQTLTAVSTQTPTPTTTGTPTGSATSSSTSTITETRTSSGTDSGTDSSTESDTPTLTSSETETQSETPSYTPTSFATVADDGSYAVLQRLLNNSFVHYWSFLVGGDHGAIYEITSETEKNYTYTRDNQTRGHSWKLRPVYGSHAHELQSGNYSSVCHANRYTMALAGGMKNITAGGFVVLNSNVTGAVFQTVFRTHIRLNSIDCKGTGVTSRADGILVPLVTVGYFNTGFYTLNGLRWSRMALPQIYNPRFPISIWPVHLLQVSCVNEDLCAILAKMEYGLYWETYLLVSKDGGRSFVLDTTNIIKKERGVSLSCVTGTTTCFVSTEVFTGSKIHRFDDLFGGDLNSHVVFPTWDVLAEVKLHCFSADECLAGASSWLGRWKFPSQIIRISDGGETYRTLHTGRVGEFFGGCRCGSTNYNLCMCSLGKRMVLFNTSDVPEDPTIEITAYNVSFPVDVGPVSQFQSFFAADILAELYFATQGIRWLNSSNWLKGNPCVDRWHGISCQGAIDGSVSDIKSIVLNANGLIGSLPASLGILSNLQVVEMHVNYLTGFIPSTWSRMVGLKRLSLFNNQLSGTLTRRIVLMEQLTHLALFNNFFSSSLPSQMNKLRSLQSLFLYSNTFTGTLPPELSQLRNLTTINVRRNLFTGYLPPEYYQLKQLKVFDASFNNLQGAVPPAYGELYRLTFFNVSGNSIQDPFLPPLIPPTCEGNRFVNFTANGPIPVCTLT